MAESGLRASRGVRDPGEGRPSPDIDRERPKGASGPTTDP
ncbi:hypothetical protein NJ7G_4061 [Natrinema sp. J7-2]|nr:hypothetical protein NJ7G_4061 [Natrinema sp. J7-2]